MAQTTVCPGCQVAFTPRNGNQRYCSYQCKHRVGAVSRAARVAELTERQCGRCGLTRPSADFSGPTKTYCRPCANEIQRTWRRRNPQLNRAYKKRSIARAADRDPDYYRKLTLRKFGLTIETYTSLLDGQGGQCGICRATEPGGRHGTWHVDHDRSCCAGPRSCGGCVRGLLCQNCNLLLGHAKDDVRVLQLAAEYLKERHADVDQRSVGAGEAGEEDHQAGAEA